MKTKNFFKVTSVCREDFNESGYDAMNLTDAEMEEVAGRIAECLLESGMYWQVLDDYGQEKGLKEIELDRI